MLKGTHVSIETKKRMSEAMKRRWLSPEWRKKYHIVRSGKNSSKYIDGRTSNPIYRSWLKNRWNVNKKVTQGSHTFKEWLDVLKKANGICAICHKRKKLTQDHIVPFYLHGSNNIENIQAICKSCNSRKGKKLLIKKTK